MSKVDRESACERIAEVLKPGDVINSVWHSKLSAWLWPPFVGAAKSYASWRIQKYQERYFGSQGVYDATHSRIYLGKDDTVDAEKPDIFEVTVPKSRYVSVMDICHEDFRVLRFTKRTLNPDDIQIMIEATKPIVGTDYDYGQLLDFLLHQVLDYPRDEFTLFDQGPQRKVCSTGVATLLNHLRKAREDQGDMSIPRLFNIVDIDIWKDAGLYDNIDRCIEEDVEPGDQIIKTPVERVTPAHFDNTRFFQSEFEQIARFRDGEART